MCLLFFFFFRLFLFFVKGKKRKKKKKLFGLYVFCQCVCVCIGKVLFCCTVCHIHHISLSFSWTKKKSRGKHWKKKEGIRIVFILVFEHVPHFGLYILFVFFHFLPASSLFFISFCSFTHTHTNIHKSHFFFFPPPLSFCVYIQFYFFFFLTAGYIEKFFTIRFTATTAILCLFLISSSFFFFLPLLFLNGRCLCFGLIKKKIIVIFLPSEYESVCSTGLRMWFFVSFISESNLILYSFHLYSFPQNIFLSLVDTICNVSMIISFLCVCLHAKRRFEGCWEADCVLTMCAVCLFWT